MKNAWNGILTLLKEEKNAKIHAFSTIAVAIVGNYLNFSATDWLWITLAIAGVWTAELFNSALERIVDLASPEQHPLAKKAKDFAAGAVLVMSIWSVIVFLLVSIPNLFMLLSFGR
jgi:diacylglycerol kinase